MLDSTLHLRRTVRPAAVAVLLGHAGLASALGFGAIHVHSALNQPLDATINLVSLTAEEKSALDVHMASLDMFQRFGIERTAIAERVRIATRDSGDPARIELHLTTTRPVREPFLRFLIEADTGAGKALREYTVLLDPPGRAPAAPALARSQEHARRQPSASTPVAPPPQPAPRQSHAASDSTPTLDHYGPVEAGDTLSRIATTVRRAGTTLDQMQVAIYRDNPQAFNDNMNILLRGAVLSIPPAERIRAIDPAKARQTVRDQHREAVSQIASAAPSQSLAEASAPPATTDARLRLEAPRDTSGALGNGAVGTAGFGRLTLPDFDALDESTPADGQSPATGATPEPEPEAAQLADEASGAQTPAVAAETVEDTATTSAEAGETVQATTDAQKAEPENEAELADTDETAADGYQPLPTEDIDVVGTGGEGGLLRPRNLLLLAAALLLAALLVVWNRRRQYKPVPLSFEPDPDDDAHEPPGGADAPVEATVYDESGTHAAVDDAKLSPELRIQEADRQIGLGLFEQARATLEKGLAVDPANPDLQDKRLELDYVSGDADGFLANIDRFEGALQDDGVRWAGIASMGRVLLPDDPRFSYPTTVQPEPEPAPEPSSPSPSDTQTPQSLLDSFDSAEDDAEHIPEPDDNANASQPYFSIDEEPKPAASWSPHVDHLGGNNNFNWQDEDSTPAHGDDEDFGMNGQTPERAEEDQPPVTPVDAEGFDLDEDSDTSEAGDEADSVEVRLDLARMYIDMDDSETARELLEEAAKEGDENQRAVAQELLGQL